MVVQHYHFVVPVIMAGGAGTRFWPLSTDSLPKQFTTAFSERSLYQQAVDRATALAPPERILIMTNERLADLVRTQGPEIPEGNIVCEPCRRDTAPAVTLAAVIAEQRWRGSVMVVMPSDHLVKDLTGFRQAVTIAATRAQKGGLVTIGIRPTYPATTYGYLQTKEAHSSPTVALPVARFVEKPDRARAEQFCNSGQYLWNSGVFVWRASTLLAAVRSHLPGLYERIAPLAALVGSESFDSSLRRAFSELEAASIDFGVMEKAGNVWTVAASFDWTDIGGWRAAADLVSADGEGNRIRGPVFTDRAKGNVILSTSESHPLLCAGIENLIVASTDAGTLVCSQEMADELKPLVQRLLQQTKAEAKVEQRPWGLFEVLADTADYKVKRITVYPGKRLSLQRHTHRSEHWHLVSGNAVATVDDKKTEHHPGQSVEVPRGAAHRIANIGSVNLVFIEVQRGDYFGEDDIERLEDDFGRA